MAASNCYEGTKEGVGFHSDALTYLGPYPTIASLSLGDDLHQSSLPYTDIYLTGTTRTFRLREVVPSNEKDTRAARTYNVPLPHNSVSSSPSHRPYFGVHRIQIMTSSLELHQLTIMHASCQEMFKHAIPPQRTIDPYHPQFPPPPELQERMAFDSTNARINITFRFFRPDFKPSNIPKCKCGVPCILRPDMKNRCTLPADEDMILVGTSSNRRGSLGKDQPLRREAVTKYWWTCHAGAQNEGKGCGLWQVMDAEAEGRGPFASNP